MNRLFISLFVLLCFGSLLFTDGAQATRYWHKKKAEQKQKDQSSKKPKAKGKEEPFAKVIKDFEKMEGLFDFYVDSTDTNSKRARTPRPAGVQIRNAVDYQRTGDNTVLDTGLCKPYLIAGFRIEPPGLAGQGNNKFGTAIGQGNRHRRRKGKPRTGYILLPDLLACLFIQPIQRLALVPCVDNHQAFTQRRA